MTPAERAAAKEARRAANRQDWRQSVLNANRQRELAIAAAIPELRAEAVTEASSSGSASLTRLRAIMANSAEPLYRRLDAADIIIDYELAPGAAVGVPPDQLASSAYQFYRAVEANPQTPEALRFRALKSIARIENSRAAAAQSPQAHHENREFFRRLVNAARAAELRKAGVWEQVVARGAPWALKPSDAFDAPALPALPNGGAIENSGDYLDASVIWRRHTEEAAARYDTQRRDALLAVRAKGRPDDWEQLLKQQ